MDFPDTMIDLETTSTDPVHGAIIQLSAVRFNFDTGLVDPDMFDMCLDMAPGRFWDEDTRTWWLEKNADTLALIQSRAQNAAAVFHAFREWSWKPGSAGQSMWAKPSHFEFPFIQSYAKQFQVTLPFHYQDAVDLNSFCRGIAHNPRLKPFEKTIPFEGTEHNAIDDVLHQIRAALLARHMIKPEIAA